MATAFTFSDFAAGAAANVPADFQIEQAASHLRTALAIVDHLSSEANAGSFVAGSYQLGEVSRAIHQALLALAECG